MTNYEKIKSMSIDELADMMARGFLSCRTFCRNVDKCNVENFSYPTCTKGIKKFLESEIKDNE